MHPRKPPFKHQPEVYRAIVQEHQSNALRMAERLQSCGWTLADAARAAVNWDFRTLAAAIANERVKRGAKPTNLSDGDLAKLRAEIVDATRKSPPPPLRPKKTTRIVRTTPKSPPRADKP